MKSNYIYLLQEREFKNTNQNIYKLGKTKQENLQRFNQYPKGSKLLLQQVCDDCDVLETQLIRNFKNKYIHKKDIGNEYFEGDHNEMIKDIHNKILNNIVLNEDTDEDNKPQIEIDDDVKELFPNYCDDETFGGTKKLIKIFIEDHKIIIKYIDCEINDWNSPSIHNYMVNEVEAKRDDWNDEFWKYKDNYYDKIIKQKVIENNKIYDLNDIKFVKRLDKYKHSIKLHYSDKLEYITDKYRLHFNNKHNLIEFYIQNNAILNDVIYCGLIKDVCYINFVSKDVLKNNQLDDTLIRNTYVDLQIRIKNINDYGFDYDYLREYTPYCIKINESNDEYYMFNRNYEVITIKDKSKEGFGNTIYLWRDGGCPYSYDKEEEIKMSYSKLILSFNNNTKNKKCNNHNQHIETIFTKCI